MHLGLPEPGPHPPSWGSPCPCPPCLLVMPWASPSLPSPSSPQEDSGWKQDRLCTRGHHRTARAAPHPSHRPCCGWHHRHPGVDQARSWGRALGAQQSRAWEEAVRAVCWGRPWGPCSQTTLPRACRESKEAPSAQDDILVQDFEPLDQPHCSPTPTRGTLPCIPQRPRVWSLHPFVESTATRVRTGSCSLQ